MSITAALKVFSLEIPSTAKHVLTVLAIRANEQDECWPSYASLSKDTSLTERSIIRAIAWLIEHRYIVRTKKGGIKTKSSHYQLTLDTGIQGDLKSGDRESGDRESGDLKSGDRESGDRESGNQVTESQVINESGDRESGNQVTESQVKENKKENIEEKEKEKEKDTLFAQSDKNRSTPVVKKPSVQDTLIDIPAPKIEPVTVDQPTQYWIPLNTGEEWHVATSYLAELHELFPTIDIEQELLTMRAWCSASPERRKTSRGIKRFIVSWLSRATDSGRSKHSTFASTAPTKPRADTEYQVHLQDQRLQAEYLRRLQEEGFNL